MLDMIKTLNGADYRVDFKAEIGATPNSIIKSEKSLLANALGGWAASLKIQNGEKVSEILELLGEVAEKEKIVMTAKMTSFIHSIGFGGDFNITFDDADELKEHPLFGDKVDLTFNDVKSKLLNEDDDEDKDPLTSWKQDLSEFNEADFDA